jgi:hypothetical protein
MNNGVRSNKGQSVTLQANKESQGLCTPRAFIVESGQDLPCRIVRGRQVDQGYENAEEAQDMHNQNNNFDGGKCTADEDVDDHA